MLEHAIEQQDALMEMYIWDYLSTSEVNRLQNATTDAEVDKLARTYRDKYWDQMLEDADKNEFGIDYNEDVVSADIGKVTKNILLRNNIHNMEEFLDVIEKRGWKVIRGFGLRAANEAFRWVFPNEEENVIQNYIRDHKNPKKEDK